MPRLKRLAKLRRRSFADWEPSLTRPLRKSESPKKARVQGSAQIQENRTSRQDLEARAAMRSWQARWQSCSTGVIPDLRAQSADGRAAQIDRKISCWAAARSPRRKLLKSVSNMAGIPGLEAMRRKADATKLSALEEGCTTSASSGSIEACGWRCFQCGCVVHGAAYDPNRQVGSSCFLGRPVWVKPSCASAGRVH